MILISTNKSILPTIKSTFTQKVNALLELRNGWHFGEGVPVNFHAYQRLLEIIEVVKPFNFKKDIFPLIDGGVNLSLMINNQNEDLHAIEIIINPDLTIDLRHEIGIGAAYEVASAKEDITFEYLLQYIELIYYKCLSEYFPIPTITTSTNKDIKALPLETVPMMEEFQSLIWTASTPTETLSVAI